MASCSSTRWCGETALRPHAGKPRPVVAVHGVRHGVPGTGTGSNADRASARGGTHPAHARQGACGTRPRERGGSIRRTRGADSGGRRQAPPASHRSALEVLALQRTPRAGPGRRGGWTRARGRALPPPRILEVSLLSPRLLAGKSLGQDGGAARSPRSSARGRTVTVAAFPRSKPSYAESKMGWGSSEWMAPSSSRTERRYEGPFSAHVGRSSENSSSTRT